MEPPQNKISVSTSKITIPLHIGWARQSWIQERVFIKPIIALYKLRRCACVDSLVHIDKRDYAVEIPWL